MHAAAVRFEIRIPAAQSLKEKRAVVKHLSAALVKAHQVSLAEVDHQDTWQRCALGVAVVASHPSQLDRILHAVEEMIDRQEDVELMSVFVSHFEEPA
ncbi:MAG: DUF503 domain-containing protein [Acidimicrobiia bacterium]|nr:DUF503 domain-containing protein [Acidimicrobiia bacterium]